MKLVYKLNNLNLSDDESNLMNSYILNYIMSNFDFYKLILTKIDYKIKNKFTQFNFTISKNGSLNNIQSYLNFKCNDVLIIKYEMLLDQNPYSLNWIIEDVSDTNIPKLDKWQITFNKEKEYLIKILIKIDLLLKKIYQYLNNKIDKIKNKIYYLKDSTVVDESIDSYIDVLYRFFGIYI